MVQQKAPPILGVKEKLSGFKSHQSHLVRLRRVFYNIFTNKSAVRTIFCEVESQNMNSSGQPTATDKPMRATQKIIIITPCLLCFSRSSRNIPTCLPLLAPVECPYHSPKPGLDWPMKVNVPMPAIKAPPKKSRLAKFLTPSRRVSALRSENTRMNITTTN